MVRPPPERRITLREREPLGLSGVVGGSTDHRAPVDSDRLFTDRSPGAGRSSQDMAALGETDRGRRTIVLLLAVAPTMLLIAYWVSVGRNDRMTLLEDDAFYYLGVARSIAEGHGSTFAGSIATNGYHPLWLLILVPVTAVVRDPDWLVLSLILLQGLLWTASVREVFGMGRVIGSWYCAAGAIPAYAVLTVLTGHLSFNGMESALVLYLFVVLMRLGMTVGDERARRDDLRMGMVLALICLTRLDAVFAAVPVAAVLLVCGRPSLRRLASRAAVLAGPPAFALAAYTALNAALFDSPTPVSGRMKALGAPGDNVGQLRDFLELGKIDGRPLWFGVIGLLIVALALLTRRWRASTPLGRLMAMTVALVVGEALLLTYLVRATAFTFTFTWYHYQLALFALGGSLILASWAIQRFGPAARLACVGLALGVVVGSAVEIVVKAREPKRVAVFAAADHVAEELPPDAMIAMGDRAGYFGYLADRPLLHLEGLVADAHFLHQVENGEALDRMRDEGVDYYVHNSRAGRPVTIDGRPCWRFVEPPYTLGHTFVVTVCEDDLVLTVDDPEGTSDLTIWRYRPELNPPA